LLAEDVAMDRLGSLPQRSYADYSFWLGDAGDLTPRSGLRRSEEVDVAILGAGYTGLWTAYYLLRTRPEWKIAVVERDIAGYGASGRNGGWCSPRFPMSAGELIRRFGAEKTRTMLSALRDFGEAMHSVCEEEGIDACFRAAGTLTLARGAHQWPSLQATFRAYQQLGFADRYHLLSAADVMTHIRATNVHGGLFTPDGASLHPGSRRRGQGRGDL
jgi:glycine/D-amino acid oxidase-like deaminating enzyme